MAKSNATLQRGFTLIEMSIVLVIIGLIVGGILKGQELIESSRQKNLISQIDRIRSGSTAFVDRFKSLPGDLGRTSILPGSSLIGGSGGNDNGIIGAIISPMTTAATVASVATTENVQFFNHLIAANLASSGSAMSPTVTLACFTGYCATPSPLPSSSYPSSGLTISYGTHPGNTVGTQADARLAHWLLLSRFSSTTITGGDTAIAASRAFQLDTKYDDGGAGSGNIRTSYMVGGAAATDACGNATSANYAPGDNNTLCHLMFTLE